MSYTKVSSMPGLPSVEVVRRDADGAFIPADPANTDWQTYQAWLKAGNAPADGDDAAATVPIAAGARHWNYQMNGAAKS